VINLHAVTKQFGDTRALDDVSCVFNEGMTIGVIGPNGSGKSTLARLLNGLLEPTSGTIEVDDITVSKETVYRVRERVGLVFQNPDNQIVASTVIDDVAFGLENRMCPPDEIERRCMEALTFVDMPSYRDHLTANLSGGQKQRIAVAGVLAMDTPYMVFDEPTSLLDAEGRRAVLDILFKLKKLGKTIIMISHFLDEVFLADKILVLWKGKVIFFDTPQLLLHSNDILEKIGFPLPLHLSVAQQCGLTPDRLDIHGVMQEYKERYG